MTILVSSSNSPNPNIISETSKDLPRSTSWKLRVSMDQKTIRIKLPKLSEKTTRKKMKEEKGGRDSFTPMSRLVSPVKKMTCAISGVFSRKKRLAGENRYRQGDDSVEITEETLAVGKFKPKQKESFWRSARIRLKILILGQRLKTRRRRSSLTMSGEEEEELCKKRILMGERCKPINKSGVLHYDGDGILLPEP